jgi:hypothetical protein
MNSSKGSTGGQGAVRWVGIDEAGYGPNLGPLVMTAVVAEDATRVAARNDAAPKPPDLWRDLSPTVDRAGGDPRRLWVDDSKAILRGGKGRDQLEAACLAVIQSTGQEIPGDLSKLLTAVRFGTIEEAELGCWLDQNRAVMGWPRPQVLTNLRALLAERPLEPRDAAWRIVAVHSVVLGPERFNALLAETGSKARAHFRAFRQLLRAVWDLAADGLPTLVASDKHGGRHYYLDPLLEAFPDCWIDRGPEGPELSRYSIRGPGRIMTLSFAPRADSSNGLVALASIVSKTLREVWMDVFNTFWTTRIIGLRPTAGYPVDARRFRHSIEPMAQSLGLDPRLWWRNR